MQHPTGLPRTLPPPPAAAPCAPADEGARLQVKIFTISPHVAATVDNWCAQRRARQQLRTSHTRLSLTACAVACRLKDLHITNKTINWCGPASHQLHQLACTAAAP